MAHDTRPPTNDSSPHAHASFLYALVLTFAFGGLVLCGFEPHYAGISSYGGDTDDVRASMFASGVCVPGGPSDKLLYSNHLIGCGLSSLYVAWPDVPWYGIYLTGSCLLAHLVIIYAVFRLSNDVRTRLAVILFVFTFGSHIWVCINFTRVACIVAMAGISLTAGAVIEEAATQRRTPFYTRLILGWALVAFAGMIRWQAVQLMGLILAPAMLILARQSWRTVSGPRHLIIASIAILSMFTVESWSQMQLRSDPGWSAFKEFERPMAHLINNRRAGPLLYEADGQSDDTSATLQSVGWTYNDAGLFDRWLFIDETVFSTQNVDRVDRELTSYTPSREEWSASCLHVLKQLITQPLLILFAILAVAMSCESRWATYITCAFLWFTAIVVLTALHCIETLEPHVTVPTIAAALLSTLIIKAGSPTQNECSVSDDTGKPSRAPSFSYCLSRGLLIGAIGLSAYQIKEHYSESRLGVRHRPDFMKLVDRLDKGPDHIYLIVLQFPFHRVSPFDTMEHWKDWHFLYTDGDLRSPRYHAFLKEHNITDLTTALYSDPRIRVITIEQNIERLATFVKEHRGIEIGYTKQEIAPITVFQLHEKP